MKILVANIGSTSLKLRLFDFSDNAERLLCRGALERVADPAAAIDQCLQTLQAEGHLAGDSDLAAVGFKTVLARGVSGCVRIDDHVLAAMEAFNLLAPAHNPPYIAGIRLFRKRLPGVPLVALFETAFYQYAPEALMRYAVPASWHDAGVRRYGFHGASHKYIAERSAELLGREDVAERARRLYVNGATTPAQGTGLRVISCHLGGSSSITGILNGVAIGTSMGLSPQSGLPQNNRVGDLDAEAIPFAMRTLGLSLEDAQAQLSRESGLKGLSGVSNDIRDIQQAAERGDDNARLALDVFCASARHWIGSYFLELNGADAIVFTAGIGENQSQLRHAICRDLDQLGIRLDPDANRAARGTEATISTADSRVRIMVIPTNEELVVAREAKRLLESKQN